MRLSTWIPLGLAIVLGLAAAVVARSMLANRKGDDSPAQLRLVVARENVAPGHELQASDLTLTAVGGDSRPEGSFGDPSEAIGRVVTSQLIKGQVVVDALLAPRGAQAGVQNLVPAGMRLITLEVNEYSSLAGMLVPGCRVDILAALSDPDTREMIARTIVENVKVQAVGQRLSAVPPQPGAVPEETAFRSVTLLVSPQEAEAVHVAATAGRPWMVLRAPGDNASNRSPGVSLTELRGNARPAPGETPALAVAPGVVAPGATIVGVSDEAPTPVQPKQRTITFIRAGKTETIAVDVDEQPRRKQKEPVLTGAPTGGAIER